MTSTGHHPYSLACERDGVAYVSGATTIDYLPISGDKAALTAALPEAGTVEMRQASRAFNHMQARPRSLVESRTGMLVAISHDLRTPMTLLRLRARPHVNRHWSACIRNARGKRAGSC